MQSGFVFDENSNRESIRPAFASPGSGGNNAFVAAVPNKKLRVHAYRLQGTGTVEVHFTDTDGNQISQKWTLQAREGCAISSVFPGFEFESPAGKGIQVNLSGAVVVHVSIQYIHVEEGI